MTRAALAPAYPAPMQTDPGAASVPGRLTVHIRKLADGSLGIQAAESKKAGVVVREFVVDWRSGPTFAAVQAEAVQYVRAHNAEHHSRVGRLITAFGNRDGDLKLHYVAVDDGGDAVRVACGKDVHAVGSEGKTLAEARAAGLLDTWGAYRCCKKCWRSPALKLAVAQEVHGA